MIGEFCWMLLSDILEANKLISDCLFYYDVYILFIQIIVVFSFVGALYVMFFSAICLFLILFEIKNIVL